MALAEWEGRYEAEQDEQLERSAYSGDVHARPIYLGSGYSEFPCGLAGSAPVLVAAFDEEVTCEACRKDTAERIARGSRPPPNYAAAALALGLGYTHAPAQQRNRLGYTLPCGLYVGREQYGSRGEPRVVTTRKGDSVNCPGCLALKAAREP